MIDTSRFTPEWLTRRLVQNGYLPQGEVTAVAVSNIQKHHCRLTVQYSPDAVAAGPTRLFLKVYGRGYAWGRREGAFYAAIAPRMPAAPLPGCYGVFGRDEDETVTILLEDLSATHRVTTSSREAKLAVETWEQVLDTYLVFHRFWWEHPSIEQGVCVRSFGLGVAHEATSAELIQANQAYLATQAFPMWLAGDGKQFSTAWHQVCEQAIDAWGRLFLKRTASGKALTMIHGDAHWQNVLLPRQPSAHTPIITDWEGCTRGIGVWDLSRLLISSMLPAALRRQLELHLLRRYHRHLVATGIVDYGLQQCYEDYRLCLIANVLLSFAWGNVPYMNSAMEAFTEWKCEDLLRRSRR